MSSRAKNLIASFVTAVFIVVLFVIAGAPAWAAAGLAYICFMIDRLKDSLAESRQDRS